MEEINLKMKEGKKILLILFIMMICIFIFSFWIGYYKLSPKEVILAFMSKFMDIDNITKESQIIFWNIRLPRIVAGLLIGMALSMSGCVYQAMFKNPLVSPDILGVSSGAGFGASIAILMGMNSYSIQLYAFLGGIFAVGISYIISTKSVGNKVLNLVLTGTMIMAIFNAGITLIKYIADPNDVLQQITFWLMGSLVKTDIKSVQIASVPIIIGVVIIYLLRWRLNLLTLEDEEAVSIGIDIKKYRLIFIISATLISASAVCLGGLIGWVGLMIPHIVRRIVGVNSSILIPATGMVGGMYLIVVDSLARSLLSLELPLGVITSILGAPFFIYLVLRGGNR